MDTELEHIRKINILTATEDTWHYQLIKERDIVGQYEAIQHLKHYRTENAYEALKTAITNKEYFYKIRSAA